MRCTAEDAPAARTRRAPLRFRLSEGAWHGEVRTNIRCAHTARTAYACGTEVSVRWIPHLPAADGAAPVSCRDAPLVAREDTAARLATNCWR